MAEFAKVTEEAKRMCWHYTRKGSHAGCPMYPDCNVSQCRKIAFERPAEFERRVMAWAAEHPEPVYPTWYEYLEKVFDPEVTKYPNDAESFFYAVCTYRIKADIAEKLGIEPKEG